MAERGPIKSSKIRALLNIQKDSPSNPHNAPERSVLRGSAHDDLSLVTAAQNGDRGAFRSLVERHEQRAFAVALGHVRDAEDARDVVQDAFVRAYRSLSSFQGNSSFSTWLYRIIANLSIDLLRKPERRQRAKDADFEAELEAFTGGEEGLMTVGHFAGSDPLDAIRRREIAERLASALDGLPSYHRSVILLREVEGLSYEEMASALNISKGTVMSRLFHARQKLQRSLADCYRQEIGVIDTEIERNIESTSERPKHESD